LDYFNKKIIEKENIYYERIKKLIDIKEKDNKNINNKLTMEQLDYMDLDLKINKTHKKSSSNIKTNILHVFAKQIKNVVKDKVIVNFHKKKKEYNLNEYSLKDDRSINKINQESAITITQLSSKTSKATHNRASSAYITNTLQTHTYRKFNNNISSPKTSLNYNVLTTNNDNDTLKESTFNDKTLDSNIMSKKLISKNNNDHIINKKYILDKSNLSINSIQNTFKILNTTHVNNYIGTKENINSIYKVYKDTLTLSNYIIKTDYNNTNGVSLTKETEKTQHPTKEKSKEKEVLQKTFRHPSLFENNIKNRNFSACLEMNKEYINQLSKGIPK